MIKPCKPKKPKKPKLKEPTKNIVEDFYLYYVTKYIGSYPDGFKKETYELILNGFYEEESGIGWDREPDGDYSRVESIDLPLLLKLLADRNIDIKNVTIDNQVYYRKCNGQIVLHISKKLSDKEYTNWVKDNEAKLAKYDKAKEAYPKLLEDYIEEKKQWDILQTELKLEKLRGPRHPNGGFK